MAKPKNAEEQVPKGFKPVSSKLDGWFLIKAGNSIQGYLRDVFTTRSQFGEKKVYKIEISSGKTKAESKEEGEFTAEEGHMIGLDEKGWLKSLASVPKDTEIYVKCLGQQAAKEAKKGQNPAWKFLVAAADSGEREPGSDDGDDVPIR